MWLSCFNLLFSSVAVIKLLDFMTEVAVRPKSLLPSIIQAEKSLAYIVDVNFACPDPLSSFRKLFRNDFRRTHVMFSCLARRDINVLLKKERLLSRKWRGTLLCFFLQKYARLSWPETGWLGRLSMPFHLRSEQSLASVSSLKEKWRGGREKAAEGRCWQAVSSHRDPHESSSIRCRDFADH